jgi:lipopolysaccharide transport system permease protein
MVSSPTNASDVNSAAAAWKDWWAGTRNVQLWWTLAWYDTVLRYRRSMLGPLWLTISMGIMLIGMGPLYASLFAVPLKRFFPYLTLGFIFWAFLAGSINDGCGVFINTARYLKAGDFPCSVFVWRSVMKNVIQLAHHIILYVPVAIWVGIGPSAVMLLAVPALSVIVVNIHLVSISLGIISARFRDVPLVISSIVQFMMFLTPVFWIPADLPSRAHFLLFNPFAIMLESVRDPLLGNLPSPSVWVGLLVITGLNLAAASTLYALKFRRIVYWL